MSPAERGARLDTWTRIHQMRPVTAKESSEGGTCAFSERVWLIMKA